MLSKSYQYSEEPIVKKQKKPRTKVVKEVKEEDEPEVYKKIRNTKSKRENNNDEDEVEVEDEIVEESIPTTHSTQKPVSDFHPVHHSKYDETFVKNLRGENEILKKHVEDLKKFHHYNHNLNNISHYSHQMKIKLG